MSETMKDVAREFVQDEINHLKRELESARMMFSNVDSKLYRSEKARAEENRQHRERIAGLEKELKKVVDDSKSAIGSLTQENKELRSRAPTIALDKAVYEKRINTLQDALSKAESSRQAALNTVEVQTALVRRLEKDIAELEGSRSALIVERDGLKKELEKLTPKPEEKKAPVKP